MRDWREVTFSDVLVDESISYGIVQPGSHTEIDSVPIIRVNNIKNGSIKTDDILKVSNRNRKKVSKNKVNWWGNF